ncbi:unnamed protein product [Vitrella brassicaformis CCMP3155]|uniref:Bicarbonate transporter-like transmembrane domain-containing protein n=1 Tax=Vitrella brassicaformis (strain CCMP3155) TaxID=1169540 RepID=A0A0G4H159_VITBC|nr:unnamed protein product [Vitrella brassicaformis CCMP3155]|eukprot:CEM37273.1 unnamed protein product [Vitrella brassicaformis CCMP3155]
MICSSAALLPGCLSDAPPWLSQPPKLTASAALRRTVGFAPQSAPLPSAHLLRRHNHLSVLQSVIAPPPPFAPDHHSPPPFPRLDVTAMMNAPTGPDPAAVPASFTAGSGSGTSTSGTLAVPSLADGNATASAAGNATQEEEAASKAHVPTSSEMMGELQSLLHNTTIPPRISWFKGLRQDIARRRPFYKSDWLDGLRPKSIPAVLFMYFACLAPAVAFGGIAASITGGSMGVPEFLVACGCGGMAYSVFSGQPMTFIGPTGLTLAFTTALYAFCRQWSLPFMPLYSWTGLWTSLWLMLLAVAGAPELIKYCTQFTDDVFNALLACNFVYEAAASLLGNFMRSGLDKTGPLLSLNVALATYFLARRLSLSYRWRFFNKNIRAILSDFGPVLTIISMSLVATLPLFRSIEFLKVPLSFQLANNRPWLVRILDVPLYLRLIAILPAILLTALFFLDHNISIRVVNSPRNQMKKGVAYNQDLFALGAVTGVLSILGLPWMCAATVQSLAHVRAMATYVPNGEKPADKEDTSKEPTSTDVPPTDTPPGAPNGSTTTTITSTTTTGGSSAASGPTDGTQSSSASASQEASPPPPPPPPSLSDEPPAPIPSPSATGTSSVASAPASSPPAIAAGSAALKMVKMPGVPGGGTPSGVTSPTVSAVVAPAYIEPKDGLNQVYVPRPRSYKIPQQLQSGDMKIASVTENRLTGFMTHACILFSVGLLSVLRNIPMSVVSGIFLYLGRKVMTGNDFLYRIGDTFADRELLPFESKFRQLPRSVVIKYTAVQLACLAGLFTLKSVRSTALFFPSVIGALMVIRAVVLPRLFSRHELDTLDATVA